MIVGTVAWVEGKTVCVKTKDGEVKCTADDNCRVSHLKNGDKVRLHGDAKAVHTIDVDK